MVIPLSFGDQRASASSRRRCVRRYNPREPDHVCV